MKFKKALSEFKAIEDKFFLHSEVFAGSIRLLLKFYAWLLSEAVKRINWKFPIDETNGSYKSNAYS